jgi:hypothetical protein
MIIAASPCNDSLTMFGRAGEKLLGGFLPRREQFRKSIKWFRSTNDGGMSAARSFR